MLRILIPLLILTACSSHEKRTPYQAYKKNQGGYESKTVSDSLRVVSFRGNSSTTPNEAERFAKLRAIEICRSENFKLAHLLDSLDQTKSKTVTRTSGSGYPSYYYGMSPYYNRFGGYGYGYGIGYENVQTRTWNETLKYPDIEVIFECTDQVYEPVVDLREVPADDMKHLVKDLRGGLQVEKVGANSNLKGLKSGDIILRANGERVQETHQLLNYFVNDNDHKVPIEIMRDGKIIQGLQLAGLDVTRQAMEEQENIIDKACEYKEVKKKALCK